MTVEALSVEDAEPVTEITDPVEVEVADVEVPVTVTPLTTLTVGVAAEPGDGMVTVWEREIRVLCVVPKDPPIANPAAFAAWRSAGVSKVDS